MLGSLNPDKSRHGFHYELAGTLGVGVDGSFFDFLPDLHRPLDIGPDSLAVRVLSVLHDFRLWYVAGVTHACNITE